MSDTPSPRVLENVTANAPPPPVPSHIRSLAIAIFANEKSVQPAQTVSIPWDGVAQLLKHREQRPAKSGAMLGGYAMHGTRSNANVRFRSIVQLDIDTEVKKDKQTEKIISVSRTAPAIDVVQQVISQYEWVANSSHSHDPAVGVIKYRVTMLPDRDILPGEHEPVLEALDELLGGCLDRGAWPLSQAFYLPSCPVAKALDAFFIHNPGIALPVDVFVARGRQIIAARQQLPAQLPPSVSRPLSQIPETPENIQIVRAMLAAIPASVERKFWRPAVWGIASLGWATGEQLARDWSMTSPPDWKPTDFAKVWSDFNPNRPDAVQFASLERLARTHGYSGLSIVRRPEFDGKGADVANGKRFALLYRGELLHIHETGEWLQFDPRAGWLSAAPLEQDRAAKAVLEALRAETAQQLVAGADAENVRKLTRHIEYTSRMPNLRAMIEAAKSEPDMTRRLGEFDADPVLLGVANGVLDLNSGKLLPIAPHLLVSKRCAVPFDQSASCPRFDTFLAEILPDPSVRALMQRLAGSCLAGEVKDQVFAFFHGAGANGKTVFVELMGWLLGDYARKIATEMLMQHQRNPQGPSPDIVALKGVRFAYANETEEGRRLAEARVKELTGGDTLTGRVPYGKADIVFQPSHTLVLAGNHKPEIADMSNGMWRRVLLIEFGQIIPEAQRDPYLLDKLKAEGAGILSWMLDGYRQWRRNGLQVPPIIAQATAAYRDEQDIIGDWIAERCDMTAAALTLKGNLYADYAHWAKANGHVAMAQGRLTRRLRERRFDLQPDKRHIAGLRLKNPFERPNT